MQPDHDGLDTIALRLLAASRVVDMRDSAEETCALIEELLALPDMSGICDLTPREVMILLLLRAKTEAAKRLLAMIATT